MRVNAIYTILFTLKCASCHFTKHTHDLSLDSIVCGGNSTWSVASICLACTRNFNANLMNAVCIDKE